MLGKAFITGGVLGFIGGVFGVAWFDHMHAWWSVSGIVVSVALALCGVIAAIAGLVMEVDV